MTNIFGVYHQILTTKSQDDAYRNTIKFLNGRMKLEKEKQQQVYKELNKILVTIDNNFY